MENLKNIKYNAYPEIILHDSAIEKIVYEDNELRWYLKDDGFAVKADDGRYYYTNNGLLIMKVEDKYDVQPYIGSYISSIDKYAYFEINLQEMMEIINSRKNHCEMVDELYASGELIYNIFVEKKKGENQRITVKIDTPKVEYRWDEINYDNPF